MTSRTFVTLLALALPGTALAGTRECAQSPGKVLEVCVSVEGGEALYEVKRGDIQVIAPSTLGLSFAGEPQARYTA
ncbi:hypothetical protein, partial [Klebsiella pneumoniae]